jgi:hypothetical protein
MIFSKGKFLGLDYFCFLAQNCNYYDLRTWSFFREENGEVGACEISTPFLLATAFWQAIGTWG